MKSLPAAALAVAALQIPALARAANYDIDTAHSSAGFAVRHLAVSNVRGEFGKVTGVVEYDAKDPSKTRVEATIDAASVTTREPKRDEHLKSPDFFDVAQYPVITFKSTKVEKGPQGLRVKGDLTLHGVTRPVALDVQGPTQEVKDPWGNIRAGASATAKINRKDFGMSFNKTLDSGGLVVGDEVAIAIDVELVKKAAPAEAKK
jgi:polyisoprenoid-binding protein YceI